MNLISGEFFVSVTQDGTRYTATAYRLPGPPGKSATATDPVTAIGLAVMLLAGYTEKRLLAELARAGEGRG